MRRRILNVSDKLKENWIRCFGVRICKVCVWFIFVGRMVDKIIIKLVNIVKVVDV